MKIKASRREKNSSEKLSQRERQVLQAVVSEYLENKTPVGSRLISRKYMSLSPATIRNTMADLEEQGLLKQPHRSAGRVPTLKGIKFFIKHLMPSVPLSVDEMKLITSAFDEIEHEEFEDLLRDSLKVLSRITSYTGLGLPPPIKQAIVREISIIKLTSRKLLVMVIMYPGYIRKTLMEVSKPLSHDDISKITNYLRRYVVGYPVSQAIRNLQRQIEEERNALNTLFTLALGTGFEVLEACRGEEVIVEEPLRLVVHSHELRERVDKVLEAMEKKIIFISLIQEALQTEEDPVVIFGEDTPYEELKGLSFVLAKFDSREAGKGIVGVLGPVHMNYVRVFPAVEVMSHALSGTLGKLAGDMGVVHGG